MNTRTLSTIGWLAIGVMTIGMVPFVLDTPVVAVFLSLLALVSFSAASRGRELSV
ncbi:hypothetical protein [Halococcus saccharolyticus]|uniref:hypothetical protein n=1 Tax=Halococcus saccharolyticus TaxID=62319 RepID=UPI000A7E7581|nr:hypothetical protein [Halococcus saccharolyticus]